MLKAVLIALAAGGFVTSAVEYKLNYNLVDLIVEKIKGLFGKGKTVVTDVKKDL